MEHLDRFIRLETTRGQEQFDEEAMSVKYLYYEDADSTMTRLM